MVGSYLNGKQEYGSKWSGIPGSYTARDCLAEEPVA